MITPAPVDGVTKGLGGLERRRARGVDLGVLAGTGIAAGASRAVPGGERAEPRNGDGLACGEGVGDGCEHGAYRGVGVGSRHGRGGRDARA